MLNKMFTLNTATIAVPDELSGLEEMRFRQALTEEFNEYSGYPVTIIVIPTDEGRWYVDIEMQREPLGEEAALLAAYMRARVHRALLPAGFAISKAG